MPDPLYFDPEDIARDAELIGRTVERIGRVLDFWFQPEVRGVERVPDGPALLVSNHNGGSLSPDSFVLGVALYRSRGLPAVPYWLAHDMVVGLPFFRQVVPLGVVRASRSMAHAVFASGRKVVVYPGGEEDTLRSWSQRDRIHFAGRTGYIRLALREGVPIVPVVVAGAQEVFVVLRGGERLSRLFSTNRWLRMKTWPLTLSFPWGLTPGPPPIFIPFPVRILIELLPAIEFERTGVAAAEDDAYVEACDRRIRTDMQDALTRLAAERRTTGRYAFSRRWAGHADLEG